MKRALLLVALLAAAALPAGVGRSEATFVAGSAQAGTTFAASAAFNGVSVALADPGAPLRGSVPLSATATSDRALVSVTFQRSPAGAGTWTAICAPTAAPYACAWDSTGEADGLYDLRAVALDASGYSRAGAVASRRVDNTAPDTTVTAATSLTGTATVSATASDAGSGVLSVALEARPAAGGAWTPICTKGTAPYSCAWNTAALAEGAWDVRATATDGAGNAASATSAERIVDNTAPSVSLADPGSPLRGTQTLSSSTGDGAGTGVSSVLYQYRANGGTGAWSTACTASTAPFSCGWATPGTGSYDLRAIATDGAGRSTTSASVLARQVDNTMPATATITNPGGPLRGSSTLSGAGTDEHSGMASMRFEYKPAAGSTWSTACTDPTAPSPFSCAWDTTAVADGSYDLRSVAVDAAGNVRSSTAVTARIVDNTGPAVSVAAPGTFRTSTTITATATDATAVQSVALQYRTAGSGAYATICTDLTSPYSCSWSPALADGAYDVRAVATDTAGNQSTSAVVAAYLNNTGPTGTDVQGANGGVDDRLDAGDRVVFTYSEAIAPSSVLADWTSGTASIRVRVNNAGTSDSMEFYDAANTTPLGLLAAGSALAIKIDHVVASAVFTATIARSGTSFTVTIGSLVSGTVTSSPKGKNAMVWQTGSQAAGLDGGKPVLPTTVTESGVSDLDF